MKKYFAIALFLISVNSVFGQLSRELNNFKKLDITDKINVNVVFSDVNKIIIEGSLANQMELIQVEDEVRLKMTGSYIMQGAKVQATVYTTELSSIVARKGAQVKAIKDVFKADSIYLSANEGAFIEAVVKVSDIVALVTTGASIELSGNANSQDVDVALGGAYFAKDLITEKAVTKVSGGGKIQINVSKSIDAQTRAGGIIDVYGNPQERKQRKFAGGKINYF